MEYKEYATLNEKMMCVQKEEYFYNTLMSHFL